MKKFFAVLLGLVIALALSSCVFFGNMYERGLDYTSLKPDEPDKYYTALNINVVSYLASAEDEPRRWSYELQIGIRNEFFESEEAKESQGKLIGDAIGEECNLELSFLNYYGVSYDIWSSDDRYAISNYTYLCYSISDFEGDLEVIDKNFGFFYYRYDYNITNPEWIDSLRNDIYEVVNDKIMKPWISIDTDAVRLRYFFNIDADLSSENAIWVQKEIMSRGGAYDCLMWEAGDNYEFTTLNATYRRMAAGWFILAILLGAAVVIVLYFVTKKAKPSDSVFRQEETINELGDNGINVIEGQISMEEYGTHQSHGNIQNTDENSEVGNA